MHHGKKIGMLALIFGVFVSALAFASHELIPKKNIVEVLSQSGRYTTLVKAIEKAGLTDTLKGKGPFTLFAPNDEAFKAMPTEALDDLFADKARLKNVLLYHVVSGDLRVAALTRMTSVKTLQGKDARLSVLEGSLLVNEAKVVEADMLALNGVIHAIDDVLAPPENR